MQYSIDWSNEIWSSLKWLGIAFAISMVCLVVVGFLLARFTAWGRQFWRVTGRYFVERETAVGAWALLVGLMLLSLLGVRMTVLFSYFSNDLYTALQTVAQGLTGKGPQGHAMLEAGKTGFWHSMTIFGVLAAIHVVRTLIETYVGAAFDIRWRHWLTRFAAADWMGGRAFYRNRFVDLGGHSRKGSVVQPGVDNPDQRIESDIDKLTTATQSTDSCRTLLFSSGGVSTNGVIPAIASIISFTKILWNLSGPVTLFGLEIPRMMVWLIFMYVLIATVVAFWIGRPLIRLSFLRERYSANFRYALVRVRDAAENVAFYRGENVEHHGLMARFRDIVGNFWQIVYRTLKFTGWNFSITQLSEVFPYLVQAPRFFAGTVKLGDLTQTASAFENVHDSLSFFRNSYPSFADLRASILRLDGLRDADGRSRELHQIPTEDRDRAVRVTDVTISTPDGRELIRALELALDPGDALVVKGRSGAGKTTLLRGLAGMWPYVDGAFARPGGERTLFLSQIPYIPLGDLRTAVSYPALPDEVGDDRIKAALERVFLPHLVGRLDDEDDWAKVLSPGEQQRVAFARILLTRPEVVFLDEATSAVDEGLEHSLYSLIRSELPDTILVSVSHRSTTDQHHREVLELSGDGDWEVRPVVAT